jgi:hypothetical protein
MPPDTLLRPLALDIIAFLAPLLVGLGAFFVGRLFNRWPLAVRVGLVGLTVGAIFVVLALLFHALPRSVEIAFSYVGGVIIVLCWMILGVIGFAWSSPKPSSDFFARFFLGMMPIALIAVEAGGSLWFRFGDTGPWHNRPTGEMGRMNQTTKTTCLPASAAMLLSRYGLVDAHRDDCEYSEGELAYLANTSFFGTDGHMMARVITKKIQIHRPRVEAKMMRSNFDEMCDRGKAFIAEVQLEKVGKHAVLVYKISKIEVHYFDPLDPFPVEMKSSIFDKIWTGSVIVIEGMEPPTD